MQTIDLFFWYLGTICPLSLYTLFHGILSTEDIMPWALLNMLREGFVVVTLAGAIRSITLFLNRKIMENKKKEGKVSKNIVSATLKYGRELFYHGIAITLFFVAHLFIPVGDAI